MVTGFYELLGVDQGSSVDEVRAAYQRQLAGLVRRLRAANRQSADVSALERQERALREAFEVLSEPARRRRYDAFRRAVDQGLPGDSEPLWELVRGAMVDPAAAAALETVRALTDMPLGDPLTADEELARPPEPPPPLPEPLVAPPRPDVRLRMEPTLRAALEPPAPVITEALPPVQHFQGSADELLFGQEGVWELYPDEDLSEPGRSALINAGPAAPPVVRLAPAPPAAPRDPVAALAERYGHDGRFLRGVRELRGLSLDELARNTRISLRYLEAIEENGYDRLPAGTFVRGYVKTLARLLQLEEGAVSDGYMALFTHHRG